MSSKYLTRRHACVLFMGALDIPMRLKAYIMYAMGQYFPGENNSHDTQIRFRSACVMELMCRGLHKSMMGYD